MEIVIEDDLFVTNNTNVVDTKIHIRHDGCCFPSDTWTDFTFPILEEWKNNLINIKNSNNTSVKLFFYDGPFWLEVKVEGVPLAGDSNATRMSDGENAEVRRDNN